ncbi:Predicted arabinose efflux permease, MFS family [Geodermatophilus amargosae]|uniref:Predicted arabinose efflux permease, MFS family n=1 Tax=Geodermatophilus amargosae TaxID=1296565 RepID=A0A1I6YIF5_9ACTN|nr:MFS transporter [Geodermatophilus amargosae]SFT50230.1 Predicted arabinose efflux permease, MFS family [Geodermatophilus amargosae]
MLDAATERDRRRRLDALTFGLFTVALGTNIPTPLLLVYRRTIGLSDADLTAVFGCYAIGLVAALTVAGAASDRFGRRTLVLPFAVLAGLSSLLFIPAAGSLPLLYTGRLLQGVVSGVVFSVANAWLQELAGPDGQQSAATRGAVSSSLGFAIAPAMSGLLAQYGPAPTTLPYLVHVAVLVLGLGALLVVPETVHERRPGRLMTLGLPPEARRPFRAVLAPTAVGVFAFPAVAATVLPLLVVPDGVGVAYAGLVGGLALGASAVAARVGRRFERGAAPLGMLLGAIGVAIGVVAVVTGSELLLLPSAALMGGGAGLCLTAGLTLTARLAPPHTRGAMNSAFYAFAYAGFGAPLLLAWVGSQLGTVTALSAFAAVPLALAAWLALELRSTARS